MFVLRREMLASSHNVTQRCHILVIQRSGLSTPEGEQGHRIEIRRIYLSANCRNKIELFLRVIFAHRWNINCFKKDSSIRHERRKTHWRVEVYLNILTSAPEGTTDQLPSPCRFTPVNSRLGGPKSQNGHGGEEKNLVPYPGNELPFLDRPDCSLISIPAELTGLLTFTKNLLC